MIEIGDMNERDLHSFDMLWAAVRRFKTGTISGNTLPPCGSFVLRQRIPLSKCASASVDAPDVQRNGPVSAGIGDSLTRR